MGTGSFPGVKCGWGVLLTTHPFLSRSWKSRAIPLPTLWATQGLQRENFIFYLYICNDMVAGEHNIMGLAVKRLNEYDIKCETTNILGRHKWMRTAFKNSVHTNINRQLAPTYWLHSRKVCITHVIQEVQASQGRNQVHNQMVIH